MAALQMPRLTTKLRAVSSHWNSIQDVDQAYLDRLEVLEERRQRRSVAASGFDKKFVYDWNKAPYRMRQTYEEFLSAVAELLGGELLTEELHESANLVFNVLCDSDAQQGNSFHSSQLKVRRERLLALFGHVFSDTWLQKTTELSRKLCEWDSHISSCSSGEGAENDKLNEVEFGADLDFKIPSFELNQRGDIDIEDDEDDDWRFGRNEDVNWQGGVSSSKQMHPTDTYSVLDAEGFAISNVDMHDEMDLNGGNRVSLRWLMKLCSFIAPSGGGTEFSGSEIAFAMICALDTDRTGDEIAGELFDLVGNTGFEQIQKILQHRKELVDLAHKGLAALKSEREFENQQAKLPSYGTQVSVQTSSNRQIEKLRRKKEKRNIKHGLGNDRMGDSEFGWLAEVGGFAALVDASENVDGALTNLVGQGTGMFGFEGTPLPQGTVRKYFKGYEEVIVPATPTASMKPGEHLVEITELDEFAQTAFEGYKSLNRIQSSIFRTAYFSNENILVCAPTGAGKTNIAMITVLHEIGQHFIDGVLKKNEFKVVYVAPMKALAAEVTSAFRQRLAPLNLVVKELTGDMQLSKRELEETQMIVTTPEKWDVITRKTSDMALAALVKLLIIDEVHLLNDDRGSVIEALVARTLRQVESTQSMIRIVGLSATLPNYLEVARFLGVNSYTGLFFFDGSYRPVPLTQQYIGVTETNFVSRNQLMNDICYEKVLDAVKCGQQAMIFVHSRKDTVKTARILVEIAQRNGELGFFTSEDHPQYGIIKKEVFKSRNREVVDLFQSGFCIHHAGMLRSDRNMTERMFSNGLIKVLVCTATLAWGVNLPAHTVIIKGTQIYDPKAGGWKELSMLDVMQIFGRAGRPQFDKSGEGIIITTHDKLAYYLRLLTHQLPIESKFISSLKDNLNAEVVLGTVTNLKEASLWLGYTYLFVRMTSNPLVYGMTWEEVAMDPSLTVKRKELLTDAARALDKAKMLRFDEKSGNLYVTDLGRVASHFYLQYTSVETYNEILSSHMNEIELIDLVARSSEFENIMVREEEQQELGNLIHTTCPVEVRGGPDDKIGKINILVQVYISKGSLEGFSLIADSAYISSSLGRIMRALFEICLHRGWASMTALLLDYCKAVDRQMWPHQHPLRQFEKDLSEEILHKLEDRGADLHNLYDMNEKEIGAFIRHPQGGKLVMQCLQHFPRLHLSANISPITRTVLQVSLVLTPDFIWKERWHGSSQCWWIWVEDSENEHIYHSEYFRMSRKMMIEGSQTVTFPIPIFEPLPAQYYIRAVSDSWLQAEALHIVSFQNLILPELHPPHTELLDLHPLPVHALGNRLYERLYKFSHFNPIQTQAFHTLYHTDNNVLLGAPTGSGKTIAAELAVLHLFNSRPEMKVIYIAPLKALVRERLEGWQKQLANFLNKKVVELTGDFTPDTSALLSADIIVSTPEKWDGISRNWHSRTYVTKVGLMIIDEIHLLGGDRGPILEVIVSRMRYISSQTECPIRFVGLSTALANAHDLADWLAIEDVGLFNFKPSVRPVPLEVHIQGYPGKFYCPRMNSMNKPAYASIMTHSPVKPVLIFVSSRRQTRLTALDLIQFATADDRPRQFLHMLEEDLKMILTQVVDSNLMHTLQFGIGLHHAGLNDRDRSLVEELFTNNRIQVLISTSTLAWGVNLPAHMVIIKGTEYYDAKTKRYIDFPITDVLQMMGRAGRPQYDQHGKAVILVHEPKKSFYKKFLYEPFPVESSLHIQLHDHFNAEVTSGSITSYQDALDYLTWTYLFRRLAMNPTYYNLEDSRSASVTLYLSRLVANTLHTLQDSGCIIINEDKTIQPLMLGMVAARYYLSYRTVSLFNSNIGPDTSLQVLLHLVSSATEYDELPVRHNEENLNEMLAKEVRMPVDSRSLDDPHVKANLLLQAHFMRLELPITDYITDTKSVLDQSIRILQAMIDMAANGGWLTTTFNAMHLLQMIMHGLWFDEQSPFLMLPYVNEDFVRLLRENGISKLSELLCFPAEHLHKILQPLMEPSQLSELLKTLAYFPRMEMSCKLHQRMHKQDNKHLVIDVCIKRARLRRDIRAFAPRYPKIKDEGWWLVLGSSSTSELYALKRINIVDQLTTSLLVPSDLHAHIEDITLFLLSDCYLGLDQQQSIKAL